ncbi:hypothetical protein RND61_30640 [Streptomyces sp. TRM76323]|uniref:Uncharacterized protein n=1 Tax=Streptomyces tamarix TaxID=3078565 RepID=A0ABU3QV15_9ACTN|nr:hypothetical protein [Streptomyces tamarix]MDT9686396.1 hypothetical protein [Streptomyces tamarix]
MEHIDRTAADRPLSESEAEARARQLIDSAYRPTSYRDSAPVPSYGPTPPVAQPGRPPMSQRATDISGLMLAAGAASLPLGGSAALVLYALGQVDPATLAVGATAPVALVLAVGSLIRSAGRAKADAALTTHHHHYTGTVRQETTTVSSTTRGLFARNRVDVR